jgi:hypothetical protein
MLIVFSAEATRVELAGTLPDFQTQPGLGIYKDKGEFGEPEIWFGTEHPRQQLGPRLRRLRRKYAPDGSKPASPGQSQERVPLH